VSTEDIIRMAREAGFAVGYGTQALGKHQRFAALATQAENARIIALLDSYRDQLRAQTRALLDEGFNADNSRAQLEMLTLLREALKA
jgi:hypothetical protein